MAESPSEQIRRAFRANSLKSMEVVDFVVGTMLRQQRNMLSMDELDDRARKAVCSFTRVEAYRLLSAGVHGLELDRHRVRLHPAELPPAYAAHHASLGNFLKKLEVRTYEPTGDREALRRRVDYYASAWKPVRPFTGNIDATQHVSNARKIDAIFASHQNEESVLLAHAGGGTVTSAALRDLVKGESVSSDFERDELAAYHILQRKGNGWRLDPAWKTSLRAAAEHSRGIATALWRHMPERSGLAEDVYVEKEGPVVSTQPFLPGDDVFEPEPEDPQALLLPISAYEKNLSIPDWGLAWPGETFNPVPVTHPPRRPQSMNGTSHPTPLQNGSARNVLEAIVRHGDDDFIPVTTDMRPTDAMPGSPEKIDILRARIELGQPLWHPEDRISYDDCSEDVMPLSFFRSLQAR